MHDIVGVTRCNQNVTTTTRRKQAQKVEFWVIGIIDNQEPRFITITKPKFSGLKGIVLVGKPT